MLICSLYSASKSRGVEYKVGYSGPFESLNLDSKELWLMDSATLKSIGKDDIVIEL